MAIIPDVDIKGQARRCERLLAELARGIANQRELGAQVYISVDGEVVADFGVGAVRAGTPMDADSLFKWYCNTKLLMAIAAAQQVERGLLSFDDLVVAHVPEFGCHGKEQIRIRDVLTHTGGFREYQGPWPPFVARDVVLQLTYGATIEPGWRVGQDGGYHYVWGAYIISEVVERLTGLTFDEYVRREVFEPLGITGVWLGLREKEFERVEHRLGVQHATKTEHGPQPIPLAIEGARKYWLECDPATGAIGPMRELGRLNEGLLAAWEGSSEVLLSTDTARLITSPHRVGVRDRALGRICDFGLGPMVNLEGHDYGCRPSSRAFGHTGYRGITVGLVDPDLRLVVAMLFNGMPARPVIVTRRTKGAVDAIYDDIAS